MLADLKEKQKKFIEMQKELLELTNQKSKEVYEVVNKKLSQNFHPETFEIMVPLSGGILADGWEPSLGFTRIGELHFQDFYYSTKEDLIENYPDVIDWNLLYESIEEISNELEIRIDINKKSH